MKQYFVLEDYQLSAFKKLKRGDIVMLNESDATMYMACRAVIPLYTAIKQGIYSPQPPKETVLEKIIDAITPDKTPPPTPPKKEVPPEPNKEFLNNSLQQIIQAKKARAKKTN